ncbi:MAG TPA: PTS sugar transporter subunit IIA [Spirochaetota bacterium]|nr:PTS sugar transporter subunit IIA [Spirochaetota bacterium]HPN11299.1 PTS sugar transporter subunit IIA [Spirochaetota bacterium]
MELSDSLKKANIIIKSKSKDRWECIGEMVDCAVRNRDIESADSKEIKKALIDREKSMSTGIGNGVAIPHCTSSRVDEIVFVVSLSAFGIDFDSIDGEPVRIIILLIVPKNKLTQHIKTLASIAKLMSNESLRERLLTLKTPEAVIKTLKDFEVAK